jgi:CMP/dCMP kinase
VGISGKRRGSMKEIVTITGEIGSGKSTVGRLLAASLGYEHVSTGMIQRRCAAQRGCTPLELNEASMHDRELDDAIDSYLRRLNREGRRLVLDSRLAWHFVQEAFDVFLYVDPYVGARRVLASSREEEVHHGLEDAVRNDLRRKHLEDERFAHLYGVQCDRPDNYGLVLDSTWSGPQGVAALIQERFQQAVSLRPQTHALFCPKSLYPTKNFRPAAGDETDRLLASVRSQGFSPREPVEIVRFSEYHFIVDGHWRVSCALRAGLDYVPCVFRGEEAAVSFNRSWISDWEHAHGFSFASYPDAAGNPRID